MSENNPIALKKFFASENKPVSTSEMREFWESLTEEEKNYFRHADLD